MSSHVILLTDAHEAPAYELIEALRVAGVKTLIEGLREVEVEVALAQQKTCRRMVTAGRIPRFRRRWLCLRSGSGR